MAIATAPAKITYRKTGKGEWVAYGPAGLIKPGGIITVTKTGGETRREVVGTVGKTFQVNGQAMVYGYLSRAVPAPRPAPARSHDEDHEDCLSFAGGCGPRCPYNFGVTR